MSKLTCAVVTPIGPGHQALFEECTQSVKRAFTHNNGGFSNILALKVDDPEGHLGIARARNLGVQVAASHGADWILFLDADDLLAENAFENARNLLADHDAIWGQIYSFENGSREATKQSPQVEETNSLHELLKSRPELSLQTGHFIRTALVEQFPFDETLEYGEDIDQYLRVWENARCVKSPHAISITRLGCETVNREMRKTVAQQVLTRYRIKHGIVEGTAPQPTDYKMDLAIFGPVGSGTQELAQALYVPGQRVILDEPGIHSKEWARHLLEQLRAVGIHFEDHQWSPAKYLTFQEFFDVKLLPPLSAFSSWGIRTTRFERWQDLLRTYPPQQLVLCIRDIRDVILSHVDVALRLGVPIDGAFIENRTLASMAALIEMQTHPHTLVRYEELAAAEGLNGVTNRLGLKVTGEAAARFTLNGGPVDRHLLETRPQLREFVDRIWQQSDDYCRLFGYERPSTTATGHQLTGTHWHLTPQQADKTASSN